VPDVSPSSTGPALAPDRLLARRYRLVRRVARGGMAEVWEAVDEILSRPVAVKILLPHLAADEAFVTRFRREAVASARLSHPHIVAVFDTWSDDGYEGIVMELVRGTTLRAVLDDEGVLPPRRVASIGAQVADALDVAHRNGLVHRDVKPGNILLTEDGRVLVTDFGIAKASEAASDPPRWARWSGRRSTSRPSRSKAARSTRAPTSTRSASCCTRRSPAARRSPPTT
jgi:serine/threonine-protein kinase